jgi:hypothetical protein
LPLFLVGKGDKRLVQKRTSKEKQNVKFYTKIKIYKTDEKENFRRNRRISNRSSSCSECEIGSTK